MSVKEPLVLTAIGLDFFTASPLGRVWRVFQYLVQLLFIVGLICLVFRPADTCRGIKIEYLSFILVSFAALAGIFLLPIPSYYLGASRVFQITLMLISPLFITGAVTIGGLLARHMPRVACWLNERSVDATALASSLLIFLVLVPYYLFNSGAVFELSKHDITSFIDVPYAISLSNHRLDLSASFTAQDLAASEWIGKNKENGYTPGSDTHGVMLYYQQGRLYDKGAFYIISINGDDLACPGYLLLRSRNTQTGTITFSTGYASRQSLPFSSVKPVAAALGNNNHIYTNGDADIIINELCSR